MRFCVCLGTFALERIGVIEDLDDSSLLGRRRERNLELADRAPAHLLEGSRTGQCSNLWRKMPKRICKILWLNTSVGREIRKALVGR